MDIRKIFGLAIVALGLILITRSFAGDMNQEIVVSKAWVQAMPAAQTTSAAYMVITNNSGQEAVLVGATSDMAGAVEIHQMSEANGMMKMAKVDSISIPAQGKVELGQGGYHIMLIDLKKPVTQGVHVELSLHFKDGTIIPVKAEAKEDEPDASQSMPGMKM